jgi:hypothetical protein
MMRSTQCGIHGLDLQMFEKAYSRQFPKNGKNGWDFVPKPTEDTAVLFPWKGGIAVLERSSPS